MNDAHGLTTDDLNDTDREILSMMVDGRNDDRPWGWTSPKTASDELDRSRQYIQNRINILKAGGVIKKTSFGVYQLTDRGVDVASRLE